MKQIFPLTLALVPGLAAAGAATAAPAKNAKPAQRPNILFCIADDASFHHFGAAGCPWVSTPAFDRVAREGIFFANCYTPNAKSAPSRACVLTGRNSWQLKEAGNHVTNFPAEFGVYPEALARAGYAIGYTGKGWAPGNPGTVDGAPRRLTGPVWNNRKLDPPAKFISEVDYAANFADFLDASAGGSWSFWYGGHEPHRAYEQGVAGRLGGRKPSDVDRVPAFWPDNDIVRGDMLDYGFEIEWFDAQLGKMLAELERRGMLENTLVVVTSDNGMPFPRGKANDYDYSCHMPLAVMWPAGIASPGRTERGYVSHIDFAPTFLEAAGITQVASGMQAITGRSLADVFRNKQDAAARAARASILLGRERDDYGRPRNQGYPIRAIIREGMMLVLNLKPELYPAGDPLTGYLDVDGSPTKTLLLDLYRRGEGLRYWELSFGPRPAEELYDLSVDVDCMNNLAADPRYAARKEALRKELTGRLTAQGDPRMTGDGDVFDRYPYDTADKWDFYEKVADGRVPEPWKKTSWVSPTDYDSYIEKVRQGKVKPVNRVATAE